MPITRRRLQSCLLLTGVMALSAGALALAQSGGVPSPTGPFAGFEDQTAGRAELGGRESVEFVGLGGGCRFFDTRGAGGPLAIGETRLFTVDDAGIPAQGGVGGGCDIPAHATAIDLSLSTTGGSPTNPGFVRVGPSGAAPTATVLQFLKGQGTSVTTTAELGADGQIAIQMNAASSHLVGDLLGYWQANVQALVLPEADASPESWLLDPHGVLAVEPTASGGFLLTLERDWLSSDGTSFCKPMVTPLLLQGGAADAVSAIWFAVDDDSTPTDQIEIRLLDASGAVAFGNFAFTLQC